MQFDYWRRVVTRAWRDTLLAFGLTSRQRVMTKLLVATVAVALIGYFGGTVAAAPKLMTGLATVGAFSLVFVAVFLWNAIAAPAKIDLELQRQLSQQGSAAERQAAIDDLAEEIDWATHNLVNPNPHPLRANATSSAISDWRRDCDSWFKKISEKLANRKFFSRAQQLHFDTLAKVDQVASIGNMEFGRYYNILHTKISRLRDIIGDRV
jgi:hypothetical protein